MTASPPLSAPCPRERRFCQFLRLRLLPLIRTTAWGSLLPLCVLSLCVVDQAAHLTRRSRPPHHSPAFARPLSAPCRAHPREPRRLGCSRRPPRGPAGNRCVRGKGREKGGERSHTSSQPSWEAASCSAGVMASLQRQESHRESEQHRVSERDSATERQLARAAGGHLASRASLAAQRGSQRLSQRKAALSVSRSAKASRRVSRSAKRLYASLAAQSGSQRKASLAAQRGSQRTSPCLSPPSTTLLKT